jgi:hypothetical protein
MHGAACVLKLRTRQTRRGKNVKCTLPCWSASDLHAAPDITSTYYSAPLLRSTTISLVLIRGYILNKTKYDVHLRQAKNYVHYY